MPVPRPQPPAVTRTVHRFLPRFYVEGFADPDEPVPTVWVHRPAIGVFQATPIETDGVLRHFNEVDEPELRNKEGLEPLLGAAEARAERIIQEVLPGRSPLSPADRDVLASFFAVLGVRLSSGFGELDEGEARRGYDQLLPALREMGWVFWEAAPPDYFVSSSAPFHVAFPRDDGVAQDMELHGPGIEITLPLTPRVALHATWRRRGELWRRATEDVLLELNARTLLRAHRFVLAPKPAIPG